jgi:hypothetical protein
LTHFEQTVVNTGAKDTSECIVENSRIRPVS